MNWPLKKSPSIIPSCDVSLETFEELLKQTADLDMVSSYKIGFVLGLSAGLPKVVEVARKYTDKPLIYDHQKAATDIPATGKAFAKTLREAGIDVAILFPQAGPETQKAWTEALREEGLGVIVGGRMTHPAYARSDGGYLDDKGIFDIYRNAAKAGITDYVAPGNQSWMVKNIRQILQDEGIEPSFYMPGFLAQGGNLLEINKVAGPQWHGIVGRGIYEAEDHRQAVLEIWPF